MFFFFWEKIINDHQAFFLYDRTNFSLASTQYKSAVILDKIELSLKFLNKKKPFAIFFPSTPHIFDTWVFARVAELMGTKILYFQQSIFPWRYFLISGLQKMPTAVRVKGIKKPNKISIERDYINSKKKHASEAEPMYTKIRLSKTTG